MRELLNKDIERMYTAKFKAFVKAVLILVVMGLSSKSHGQISSTGKEFHMSFLEMETRNGGLPDTLLIFVTSETDTRVRVDNPRLTGSTVTVNIQKNKVNRIAVDNSYYYPRGSEFNGADQNSKKGLRLLADAPVNVYCLNLELNRSDGTFVLPYESIPAAPEFFITSFPPNARNGSSYTESEFVVVGMDNGVKVEITPAFRTKGGKSAGTPFTVTLGKGQVYQVQSDSRDGTNNTNPAAYSWTGGGAKSGDLTGTRVRVIDGCGKINVFAGNRSSYVPRGNCAWGLNGKDHLYTQVLPVNALGKDYVLMPYANQNNGFVYRVVAAYDSTYVKINGSNYTMIPKKGDWISLEQTSNNPVCVNTSKPAYTVQYMKNGVCNGWSGSNEGDAAIFISPDVNQRLLRTIVGTATTSNMRRHWVNILVDKNATHAVKLNGSFINKNNFKTVTCGDYAYAQISVVNPSSNIIECDSGCIVVAYGTGPYESYSYSAGALFESVEYDFKMARKGKCPSEPVTLTAEYTNKNVTGIRWNFGDGTAEESGDTVVHQFEKVGTYYVIMKSVVLNNCNKIDTVYRSKIINVLPGPIFDFPDTTIQCANNLNVTMEGPLSNKYLYTWQDSSKKSTYNVTSDQKVWLRVLDTATACAAVDSSYVMRANIVIAGIAGDSVVQCNKENYFRLSDGSTYNNDVWKSSRWETVKALTFEYVNSDSFTFDIKYDSASENILRYIVETQKGCRDTLDTLLVVHPYPVAKMQLPFSVYCQGAPSIFVDASESPTGRYISYWSFSDGGADTNFTARADSSISYVFNDSGTLGIRLITETDYGCRDTVDSTFVINPIAEAQIGTRTIEKCFLNNEFELSDNTLYLGAFDNQWLVDGKTYNNSGSFNVTFSDTGTHKFSLITITDVGCRDTIEATLFVAPEPKAVLVVTDSSQCYDNHFFKLECQSTAPKNATLTARSNWVFEDGTNAYAKIIPNKTLPAAGTYWVRLIAETTDGCKDSVERNIEVFHEPDASITPDYATQCLDGNSFRFVSAKPWSISGKKVTHFWDLGDGKDTNLDSIDHSYSGIGSYLVKHVITTEDGCKDSVTTEAYVVSSPAVDFVSNKDTACFYSQGFNLINNTNYNGTFTNNWVFSDGTKDANTDVINKKFLAPGLKLIKLVVTTDKGCKDSLTKTVEVFTVPQAQFSINQKTQCIANNVFTFVNSTLENGNPGSNYDWAIVGKSPVVFNGKDLPNQTLTDTGWHDVYMLVTSPNNCVSGFQDRIYVAETPQVSITGRDGCQGEPLQFGRSLILNSGTPSYNWEFGDGRTSSVGSPQHTYTTAGSFVVKLTVTSDKGCVGKAMDFPLQIFTKPSASFTSEYLLSRGMETDWKFNYTGSGADQLNWKFEDGQSDNGLAPVFKTFSTTGDFKVGLFASTANGCRDSAFGNIFLKPELLMWLPNVFTPNIDGLNDDFGPSSTFGLERYSFKIYDRWGSKVFDTDNPENRWTGLDPEGKPIMEGVYGYELLFRYVDNRLYVYKGTVIVTRP
jgi:gliding motility-associated-like protein